MNSIKIVLFALTFFLCTNSEFLPLYAMEDDQASSTETTKKADNDTDSDDESEKFGDAREFDEQDWTDNIELLKDKTNTPDQAWQDKAVAIATELKESQEKTANSLISEFETAIRGNLGEGTEADGIIESFKKQIAPEEQKEEATEKVVPEEKSETQESEKEATTEEKDEPQGEEESAVEEVKTEGSEKEKPQEKATTPESKQEEAKGKSDQERLEELLANLQKSENTNNTNNTNKFYNNLADIRSLAKTMGISAEDLNEKIKGALKPKDVQSSENKNIVSQNPTQTATQGTSQPQSPQIAANAQQQNKPILPHQQSATTTTAKPSTQPDQRRIGEMTIQEESPAPEPQKKNLSLVIAQAIKANKESEEQKGIFSFIKEKITGPGKTVEQEISKEATETATYKDFVEKLNKVAEYWGYAPTPRWQQDISPLAVAAIEATDLTKEDAIYLINQTIDNYDKKQWRLSRDAEKVLFAKNDIFKEIYGKLYPTFKTFFDNFNAKIKDPESQYLDKEFGLTYVHLQEDAMDNLAKQAAQLILSDVTTIEDLERTMDIELQKYIAEEKRLKKPRLLFKSVQELGLIQKIKGDIKKSEIKAPYRTQEEAFIASMKTARNNKTLTDQEIHKRINAFCLKNKNHFVFNDDKKVFDNPEMETLSMRYFLQVAIYCKDYNKDDRDLFILLTNFFFQEAYFYFSPSWSGLTIKDIGQRRIKEILGPQYINAEEVEKIVGVIGTYLSETGKNLTESTKFKARKEVIEEFIKKETKNK